MLSHFGLDHVGLDGAAKAELVVICDGAPPVLQVQEGVRRLGALGSVADAGQGVRSRISEDGEESLVTDAVQYIGRPSFQQKPRGGGGGAKDEQ